MRRSLLETNKLLMALVTMRARMDRMLDLLESGITAAVFVAISFLMIANTRSTALRWLVEGGLFAAVIGLLWVKRVSLLGQEYGGKLERVMYAARDQVEAYANVGRTGRAAPSHPAQAPAAAPVRLAPGPAARPVAAVSLAPVPPAAVAEPAPAPLAAAPARPPSSPRPGRRRRPRARPRARACGAPAAPAPGEPGPRPSSAPAPGEREGDREGAVSAWKRGVWQAPSTPAEFLMHGGRLPSP
eukprot:tig00001000_g6180.t1